MENLDLKDIDFEILKFVAESEYIEKDDIINHFDNSEIVKYRLSVLTMQKPVKTPSMFPRYLPNSSPLEHIYERPDNVPQSNYASMYKTDKIRITELGLLMLQEHEKHIQYLQYQQRKEQTDHSLQVISIIISLLVLIVSLCKP